jgi:hypothetical protein
MVLAERPLRRCECYLCAVWGDDDALEDEASASIWVAAWWSAEALVEHHLDRLRASDPVRNLGFGVSVAVGAGDPDLAVCLQRLLEEGGQVGVHAFRILGYARAPGVRAVRRYELLCRRVEPDVSSVAGRTF